MQGYGLKDFSALSFYQSTVCGRKLKHLMCFRLNENGSFQKIYLCRRSLRARHEFLQNRVPEGS